MSVLVADAAAAVPLLAAPLSATAKILIGNFWPGSLTLIVEAASDVDESLLGPGGGIGLRCPDDSIAMALVKTFGGPITATSANPSTFIPAADVASAREYFGDEVGFYLDGGPRRSGSPSTVVSLLGGKLRLLREGAISADRIQGAVGPELTRG